MTFSLLPDVNIWVALHHTRHLHHQKALEWFEALDPMQVLVFCRQSQIGLFRLLTTAAAMGDETITQRQCWAIYDRWIEGGRAVELTEPAGLALAFRSRTEVTAPAPKTWTDAYLAAFAETAELTLVTFDRALAGKTKQALLLQ
ncbi:MAG: TA system VapC family ribonuclease toxin [Terracidiphilus sp.]